jgi:type II secretory pathway pseudopilin PulG
MITQLPPLKKRRAAGFTIVELLVVIAILFVLIGLVMVALRTGRRAASRTESLNALRQMTSAYNVYATEHKGRLMPGYIDVPDFAALDIGARLRAGFDLSSNNTLIASDVSSYVWRLAPYLDHDWSVFMTDYRDEQLVAALGREYDGLVPDRDDGVFGPATVGADEYGIARVPSYGLNSIFLGGDSFHGPVDHSPWNAGKKPFVASRLSEVMNPAKIIVFGACKATEDIPLPTSASVLGYCELRAPKVYGAGVNPALETQWTVNAEGQAILEGNEPAGLPISRLEDDRVPISHLDGSTEAEYIHRLAEDMSRWAPNAVSSN